MGYARQSEKVQQCVKGLESMRASSEKKNKINTTSKNKTEHFNSSVFVLMARVDKKKERRRKRERGMQMEVG